MAPAPIRSAVGPSTAPIYPRRLRPSADQEYRPFPNEEGRNSRQGSLEVPLMIRALGLPAGGRVLEVGCGRGVALPVLARRLRPSRLVGLDLDIEFLEEARSRLGDAGITAELVPGDVRRMPFPEAAFDLVVDFGTCYHIARPQAALAEIARVLAPGGLFIHETPLSQVLSHPVRSFGRRMPWRLAPLFERHRTALLWTARRRCTTVASR
jgi:ubiquinone/menaquinone biosynthesis C-methylase UbiE